MRILVSGGGTGGHIYPALALVRALKNIDPQLEVLYIGTENGLEKEIVSCEGLPFKSIEIAGFKRSLSLDNVKTIMKFLKSVAISKKYIKPPGQVMPGKKAIINLWQHLSKTMQTRSVSQASLLQYRRKEPKQEIRIFASGTAGNQ